MTASNAVPPSPPPIKLSGFQTALRYTGIPPSWLNKRPKLPSRNWLIFISLVSSVTSLYIYDRRECKRIRQKYVDLVKDQANELVDQFYLPRRVVVYGSKWPGDEDYDQGMRYFRKYVKPVLVAAAVDFQMVTGKRHGELTRRIANDIRLRRRLDLGIDTVPPEAQAIPTTKPLAEKRQHELDGGIVIIGRPTFKEFMAGLKKGWTDGLEEVAHDEVLARELESDGHFDEPEEAEAGHDVATFASAQVPNLSGPLHSPLYAQPSNPASIQIHPPSSESVDTPTVIPPIPPLLLVPFTDYIGFTQMPRMIWDFFNQRHKVRSGAEAGYRLVMKYSRPIIPPLGEIEPLFTDITPETHENGDIDFDKHVESFYKKSLFSIPKDIEKAREKYYEALPAKLATARALARGARELTKEEKEYPPPTEVELSAERMKNEQRWRRDLEGWGIVNPAQKVMWDDRFRNSLRIFINPPPAKDNDNDID